MKKSNTVLPEIIYYSVMVFLYLIIVATLINNARKIKESSHFISERYAERQLIDFSINYFLKGTEEHDWLNDEIRGIGIYNARGESVETYGTAPPSLEDFVIENRVMIRYERAEEALIYIRAIPPFSPENREMFSLEDNMPRDLYLPRPFISGFDAYREGLSSVRNDEWLILFLDLKDFWYSDNNQIRFQYHIMIILFPLLLALFVLGACKVFHRLVKSQRQLDEQKNLVLLGTAVRTISHEMKNPLGAIYLQIPLIDKLTGGEVQRETNIIKSEVERMSSLISWISDFIKDPEGMADDLDLTEEMASARRRFPEELEWHFPEYPVTVVMDPERFRSVLDNLVNNALESGSSYGDISVSLEAAGNKVSLRIRDKGLGIPEMFRKKVFDPFFTSKSRGSGVGLAVTGRFVEAAGGSIYLESEEGEGTEVTVVLKRKK